MFIFIFSIILFVLFLGIIESLFLSGRSSTRFIFGPESGLRIVLGPAFQDARGKLGTMVFSIWKAGKHYVRSVANIIANPSSADQAAIRCQIAAVSKAWFDTLTIPQREGWNDWAQTKPGMGDKDGGIRTIIKGNGGIMSGYNAFIMANQWLKSAGLSAIQDAPLGATPPTPPTNVSASYAANKITVIWTESDIHKLGNKVRVFLASHSPGIHRQLVGNVLNLTATYDIENVKGANGDTVPISDYPGVYLIQLDCVDDDGTKSAPSVTVEVEVT